MNIVTPAQANAPGNPIMEVKNLSAFYNGVAAVKDVSLNVHTNEVFALIGPSGCGKSTFLRTLNRMHEEISDATVQGYVLMNGRNIYDHQVDPVDVRTHVGMLFQKPNPFPSMSIFDNVVAGLRLRGRFKKADLEATAERCLKNTALWDEVKDKLKRPATSLSGGQQQRLCMARTLAVNPQVVLMDEPTSALDPISTARIEELMTDLKKSVTVVIVTHNMLQAARISDRTAFFLTGELIEIGPTNDIFKKPTKEKTQHYISGKFG